MFLSELDIQASYERNGKKWALFECLVPVKMPEIRYFGGHLPIIGSRFTWGSKYFLSKSLLISRLTNEIYSLNYMNWFESSVCFHLQQKQTLMILPGTASQVPNKVKCYIYPRNVEFSKFP